MENFEHYFTSMWDEYNCAVVWAFFSLFNLFAEYIMRNAGLEEAQAGIKITRRNINNLRYNGVITHLEPDILESEAN